MKYRVNIILVFMMIGFGLQSSNAQRSSHGLEKLDLTEDQQLQLKALQEEKKTAFDALSEDATKEEKMELRAAFQEKMGDILTAEQLAAFNENRESHSQRRGHRADGERAFKRKRKGDKRSHKRGELTEDQKAQLAEARAQLDNEISIEDKRLINELREKSKALKASYKEAKDSEDNESWKALKEEKSAIHEPLKELSGKYKDQIKEVLASVDGLKRKDFKPEGESSKHKKHTSRHHKAKKFGHFLLLDPEADVTTEDVMQLPKAATLSLSPNPAVNQTTVNYTVNTAGPVVIDIRNEQGEVIKTLLNETKGIGSYDLNADLNEFQNKSYYITITDRSGTQSEQLIIVK